MKITPLALAIALAGFTSQTSAQTVHFAVGLAAGDLIVGGKSSSTGTAPTTGGFTILPKGEVAVGSTALPYVDATFSVVPMIVNPSSLDVLGVIWSHDLGLDFHPENRVWGVAVKGSFAPAYMKWCNVQWCLREWAIMPGGEVAVIGHPAKKEAGVDLVASVRVFHAEPTAWTWPGLSAQDRAISHEMVLITGAASWRW